MSRNLRKCMKTMHLYCEQEHGDIKDSILDEMSKNDCYFEAIFEIIENLRIGKLRLPPSKLKHLKVHLNILDEICDNPKSNVKRRKLVKQTGGFLQIVLPILTTIVAELISNAISKKSDSNTT